MIVFDTEDDSKELLEAGKSGFDKQITQIAAICDNGKKFYSDKGDVKGFLKWCHEAEKVPQIWAFNAQYDVGNLCTSRAGLALDDFDIIMVKGRFISAKLEGMNFFDCRNISGGGSSVKSLGEAVGLKKLDGGDFRSKKYVFRDCEIPMRWLQFVKSQCVEMGIEKIPATLGGLCVKAFYALEGENWFCADDRAKLAMRGARVELFSGGGQGNFVYTDINSLYPWCMTQIFPDGFSDLAGKMDGYGVAEALIEIPKMVLCPLPAMDDEGRMIFPYGRIKGVWTFHELKNAVKHGCVIKKINWSAGSLTGHSYYRDYVETIYKKRMAASSGAENLFWKLLLNNLYGRLAISGVISRSLRLTEENKDRGIVYGKKVMADYEMPKSEFTNYLHAAYVLSYARIKLFGYLKQIPEKSLVYCDTDSAIFFNDGFKLPFPTSKNLGEMKLEGFGEKCVPYAPKMYEFAGKFKAKGVPARLAREFIETGHARYDLPFKLRESVKFYERNNSPVCPECKNPAVKSVSVFDDTKEKTEYLEFVCSKKHVWKTRRIKMSVWRKVEKIRQNGYTRKKIKGGFYLPFPVKMF